MITVKLYGLLRVESGIKERRMEASSVGDVLRALEAEGIQRSALAGCVILVNGAPAKKRTTLKQGDVVQLLPPVAGG